MGLTFKENTPDMRNSRAVDVVHELEEYGFEVDAYDPWVSKEEAEQELGLSPITKPEYVNYDAIVLAVPHIQFTRMGAEGIRTLCREPHVIYDVKHCLPLTESDLRL